MDEDTRRLPAFLTKPTNNGVPNYGATNKFNNANNTTNVLNTEDQLGQTNNNITASPGTASDSSPKPQKRRNKPSLSCETCTVSQQYKRFLLCCFLIVDFEEERHGKERPFAQKLILMILIILIHVFYRSKKQRSEKRILHFSYLIRTYTLASVTVDDQCI